jgi:hypothetical protein
MNYSYLKNTVVQEKMTVIIDDLKVFFAFSESQLEEGLKKTNTKREDLVSMGMGGFIPKVNVKEYHRRSNELMEWFGEETKKIKAEKIIEYELSNHECYYTGDITDALEVLKVHGFTHEQVLEVYKKTRNKYDN